MKIPQSTFDNVISISVDKFKSFLTMRPSDKRKILDQIFGILFFNKIHDSLKEFVKDFNVDIGNLEGQVRVLMENKKTIEEKIKSLDAEKSKDITDKLEEVIENINSLTESMLEMVENSKDIDSKASLAFEKMTKLTKTKNEYSFKIKDCNHKLKVYDSDVCPTCNSDLTDDVHIKNKEKIREEKLQYENDLKGVKVSIDKLKGIQSIIDKKKQVLGNTIYETRLSLDKLKGKQENLSKPKVETNEFDSVLENTIEKIDLILTNIQEKKKDEYLYAELSKVFGEDGVKLQIMKNFLPSFNKSINEISKKLHFPYKVEIDERFNSKLISIGEEINPKTLSTGERKKADFAVLISLIHIMKRNYPNINLLFLDEILASLDANSIHEVLLLIRNVVDELDLTVFVINHSELPKEMFDFVYSVNKVAGFSELLIDEC